MSARRRASSKAVRSASSRSSVLASTGTHTPGSAMPSRRKRSMTARGATYVRTASAACELMPASASSRSCVNSSIPTTIRSAGTDWSSSTVASRLRACSTDTPPPAARRMQRAHSGPTPDSPVAIIQQSPAVVAMTAPWPDRGSSTTKSAPCSGSDRTLIRPVCSSMSEGRHTQHQYQAGRDQGAGQPPQGHLRAHQVVLGNGVAHTCQSDNVATRAPAAIGGAPPDQRDDDDGDTGRQVAARQPDEHPYDLYALHALKPKGLAQQHEVGVAQRQQREDTEGGKAVP